jgi:hypothetical protein
VWTTLGRQSAHQLGSGDILLCGQWVAIIIAHAVDLKVQQALQYLAARTTMHACVKNIVRKGTFSVSSSFRRQLRRKVLSRARCVDASAVTWQLVWCKCF